MSSNSSKFEIIFLDHLGEQSTEWDALERDNSYWSACYFNNLVENPPKGVRSHACLVRSDGKAVAKLLFQYLEIDLKNNFGSPSSEQKKRSWLNSIFRTLVVPLVKVKIIVNGNLLLSGSYGYKFDSDLSLEDRQTIFDQSIQAYRKFLKSNKFSFSGILLKDLDNSGGNLDAYLVEQKYSFFKVQPKMKFIIKDKWSSFDNYLAGLKSKYRVRYRKARKSLDGIERRLLTVTDLETYQDDMYSLYMQIVNKAGFNLFYLDKAYFLGLIKVKPNKFRVNGLFKDGKMVAFYSLMDNAHEMDAHYLGYDLKLNGSHKLYLNMLYYMVEEAIELGKDELHMSRTALEIKSSVGTIPEEVSLYGKHFNSILNGLLGKILEQIVPKVEWKPRNPFK